jgi:hypothetical protein
MARAGDAVLVLIPSGGLLAYRDATTVDSLLGSSTWGEPVFQDDGG